MSNDTRYFLQTASWTLALSILGIIIIKLLDFSHRFHREGRVEVSASTPL